MVIEPYYLGLVEVLPSPAQVARGTLITSVRRKKKPKQEKSPSIITLNNRNTGNKVVVVYSIIRIMLEGQVGVCGTFSDLALSPSCQTIK